MSVARNLWRVADAPHIVPADAENITVGQVCAESERSNAAVKTVKR